MFSESIFKRLQIVPAQVGVNPFAKTKDIAGDIRNQSYYITIPAHQNAQFQYARQLLFQFNASFINSFVIVNLTEIKRLLTSFISGGCLCVKWRVGETVYRYKLLDHFTAIDWSFFPDYTNQTVGANFCIEFWGDSLIAGEVVRGILQPIIFRTSEIIQITDTEMGPNYYDINNPFDRDSLGVPLPWNMPVNLVTEAWISN